MNITETSRKDEVITAACELVDQQEAVIKALKEKQNILLFLLSLTSISLIFWTLRSIMRNEDDLATD